MQQVSGSGVFFWGVFKLLELWKGGRFPHPPPFPLRSAFRCNKHKLTTLFSNLNVYILPRR